MLHCLSFKPHKFTTYTDHKKMQICCYKPFFYFPGVFLCSLDYVCFNWVRIWQLILYVKFFHPFFHYIALYKIDHDTTASIHDQHYLGIPGVGWAVCF